MEPYVVVEAIRVVTLLSRHTLAGMDGFKDNFVKDYQALTAVFITGMKALCLFFGGANHPAAEEG